MTNIKVPRDENGHFLKGHSGNPGGIHRDAAALRLKMWAVEDLRRAYDYVWQLIEDEGTKCTTKASLLGMIIDRAVGKVRQAKKEDDEDDPLNPDAVKIEAFTGAMLFEKIEQYQRILAAKEIEPKAQDVGDKVIEGELM